MNIRFPAIEAGLYDPSGAFTLCEWVKRFVVAERQRRVRFSSDAPRANAFACLQRHSRLARDRHDLHQPSLLRSANNPLVRAPLTHCREQMVEFNPRFHG